LKCFVNEFCFGQGRGHSINDLSSDARKKKQNRNETSKSVSSFIGKLFGSLFARCFCTTQSLDRMKFQNFFFNLHVPACLSVKVKDKTDLFFKLQFSHTIYPCRINRGRLNPSHFVTLFKTLRFN
jgi:hypothetical protein